MELEVIEESRAGKALGEGLHCKGTREPASKGILLATMWMRWGWGETGGQEHWGEARKRHSNHGERRGRGEERHSGGQEDKLWDRGAMGQDESQDSSQGTGDSEAKLGW